MLPEITDFAVPVAVVAGALVAAALLTALPVSVPSPALFLLGAAITSDLVAPVRDHVDILTVERVAVVALVVILFDGGRDIGAARLRASLAPVASLGLTGTFLTAGVLAVAAHLLVGLGWKTAGVLGAALAPTDPAVMFSVLGQRELRGRARTILEGEAGLNDPAGIALLLGLVQVATHPGTSVLVVVEDFGREIGIGALAGLAGGWAIVQLLSRVRLGAASVRPVLALGLALLLYAATTLIDGSGFTAVFVAGLLLGDGRVPRSEEITGFVSGLAGLAEVAVFLALGLTVDLGGIAGRDWLAGLGLLAVVALLARPLAVAVTLASANLTRREKAFIASVGLKGAVPVLLAAFAVLAHVAQAPRLYDIVFVVVLGSVVLQGSPVGLLARSLGVAAETGPGGEPARVESRAVPGRERPPLDAGASPRRAP